MNEPPASDSAESRPASFIARLQKRGVIRVAFSYAIVAWLLLQIGDVILEPLDAPAWVMRALILLVVAGFPVALLLAWFFELGPDGVSLDKLPESASRPIVKGVRRYTDAIIIAFLLAVIALLLARQEGWLQPAPAAPVIAVLPFTDLGSNAQSFQADGLSDTLIHKLGQLSGLVVLASNSTFQFRGTGLDLGEVASKLGANVILEGTLQRAGGVLRINTRLVDPATGQQRWTASFNRRAEELFDIQDEIATAITAALKIVLSPREEQRLVHRDTLNLTAFEAYQQARHELAQRTPEGMTAALQFLFDATTTDPRFALAWASLPEAYYLASTYRPDTPWSEVAGAARAAADQAVDLDPELGEAWLGQAYFLTGQRTSQQEMPPYPPDPEISALLEKAIALNPNNAVAWKLYADHAPDNQQKLERYLKAAQLDPRHPNIVSNVGSIYEELGQVETARRWYLLALGLTQPPFWQAAGALVESYSRDPGGLASAARWMRAIMLANPEEKSDIWRDYCRALAELGAVDELQKEQTRRAAEVPNPDLREHLFRVGREVQLLRQRQEYRSAAEKAPEFEGIFRRFMGKTTGPLDPRGPPAAFLDSPALYMLQQGQPEAVLDYYDQLYSSLAGRRFYAIDSIGLNARLIRAVALKKTGRENEAIEDLRSYASEIPDWPPGEQAGLVPFAIHALLGETELAITAFQKAVESNDVPGWWALEEGTVDPDYTGVFSNPEFQQQFNRLKQSIASQRVDFLANPDLPLELRITAGLLPAD